MRGQAVVLGGVLAGVTVFGMAVPAFAAGGTTEVELSPATVAAGGKFAVWAKGCSAGGTAESAAFDRLALGAGEGGSGTGRTIVRPGTRPGQYPVRVSCVNGDTGTATLTVIPGKPAAEKIPVGLTPKRVAAGGEVDVHANARSCYFDDAVVSSKAFDTFTIKKPAEGPVEGRATVRAGTKAGTYRVTVRCGISRGTATLTVTGLNGARPAAAPSPSATAPTGKHDTTTPQTKVKPVGGVAAGGGGSTGGPSLAWAGLTAVPLALGAAFVLRRRRAGLA